MAWHYIVEGASKGPIDEAELRSLLQQNVITPDTPVWTDGMANWLPYHSTPLAVSGASLAPTSGITRKCVECGKLFPEDDMLHYEQSWVCATCKPIFFQRVKEGVTPRGTLTYASVGKRFAAIFIDGIILVLLIFVPVMIMIAMMTAGAKNSAEPNLPVWFMPVMLILQYGLPAAFEIFFIGKYGATPGKMLMKIKVVTPEGGSISYGRSTGRYFSKMLSAIILYIGFLMAFWDDEKRALHDRICQTRVISTEG